MVPGNTVQRTCGPSGSGILSFLETDVRDRMAGRGVWTCFSPSVPDSLAGEGRDRQPPRLNRVGSGHCDDSPLNAQMSVVPELGYGTLGKRSVNPRPPSLVTTWRANGASLPALGTEGNRDQIKSISQMTKRVVQSHLLVALCLKPFGDFCSLTG